MSSPFPTDHNTIDKYIGHQVRRALPRHCSIRPSQHFANHTLENINRYEKNRSRLIQVGLLLVIALPPLIHIGVSRLWQNYRHDYFSVGTWPLIGRYVAWLYTLFLTSWAIYLALGSGLAIATLLYFLRNHRLDLSNESAFLELPAEVS